MTTSKKATINQSIDYEYWSKIAGWTIAEAAALFLDVDPDRVPDKSDQPDTPGWHYWRLHRLLNRARQMGELDSPMSPREFIAWGAGNGLKPSENLEIPIRAGKPHRNWKVRYQKMRKERNLLQGRLTEVEELVSEPLPKARNTLLTIIGSLIRVKLNHTPGSTKTVSLIQDAVEKAGCELSNTTIRTCVDAVDSFLAEKYPKNSNEK